jgi:hypothetical protein
MIPRRRWLVGSFAIRGHLTVLVAPPGAGKSTLGIALAVAGVIERRPERNPPRLYLAALEWAAFGTSVPKGAAALGDVLVFKRKGGGHVGLYIGHDTSAFHVLGGNQSDRVSITRLSRNRLVAVRRPPYRAQPANVRPIPLAASGSLSVNEA